MPDLATPRSIGVKLLIVGALALAMTIPGLFLASLVEDRTSRAADVVRQISASTGGAQTFLGPTLLVPFKAAPNRAPATHAVFPATASASVKTSTEERRRSLFKVPVFRADLQLDASFDLTAANADLDWERAEIVVGVTDPRGALADATVSANGKTAVLAPAQTLSDVSVGKLRLKLLGVPLSALAAPNAKFDLSSSLHFSGAQRIAVLAYGKTTRVAAQGDWPSPGFDGGFLPTRRAVTDHGFTAEWQIPFIARGVRAEGPVDSLAGLDATALGASFIAVADPYQSVNRCLKYVLLFVGLVFLSYFVFEVTTGKRVHPAQYLLVGIAQVIFYLLLLSLAERVGFDWAFLIGGGATVALLATNAGWLFDSRAQGLRALAVFSTLYALIYFLLRAEDNALLIGAVMSFLAVAAAMYFTRKIDWYSAASEPRP